MRNRDSTRYSGAIELQWRTVAKAIAELNFDGFFAHEFVPLRDPMKSLAEAVKLCEV